MPPLSVDIGGFSEFGEKVVLLAAAVTRQFIFGDCG